jgi:hypothetical protein
MVTHPVLATAKPSQPTEVPEDRSLPIPDEWGDARGERPPRKSRK